MVDGVRRPSEVQFAPFNLRKRDLRKYLEIQRSIEAPWVEVTTSEDEAKAELRDMHSNFLMYDGKLTGFVAHQERGTEAERHGYVWELAVLPNFRGYHIGEDALREVLKSYKDLPCVCLQVDPENNMALVLYLKLGFKITRWIEGAASNGRPRLAMSYFNRH